MKEMNLSEAQNGLVAFNSQLSETTQSLNSFAEQISKTFQDTGSSVDDASNKFAGSLEKWNKAFETLSEASTVVFTSLSALIGTSTTAFANYQSTLQQVQISANIGRDNLENFKRTSEQLAQTTQFSTQQVAAAGLELIKMGLSAREAENALQSVTTVATAQNASLEQTATSMGSVMQAFGLSANEAGKVGDLIQVSGMSVKEFGDAMTSLGPAAVNSGQSINDMAMLLGIFGDSGIKSADGAKGLVSALEGLHDPKVATALRARKIETADMVEILKKLRTSIGDLPSLEQSKILKEIFGGSASTSLQTFVSMSDQELDKAIKKYGDFQGAAGKAAEEVKKGLLYAITDLKNSIQSLFSEIGASLAPTMTVMIKSITSVINAFNSMPDSIKSVISHVGLLATGVAGAFIGAKGITGFVTKGIEGFSELSTLLSSKVSPASKNATNELITLKKAQKSILENSLANTISVNPAVPKELLLSDTTAAKALSAIIPTNSTTNKANTATRQVSSPLTNSFAGAIPAYLTTNKAPTVTGQASAALTNALAVASPANSTTNKAIAAAIPTSATANKAIVATGQASATAAVGVNTFRTSLSSVPGMLGNLALAASTAFKTIGKSVVSATLPILPFVALAGALYLAWETNLGGFRDILDLAWATVQDVFGNITGFITDQMSQNQVLWFTVWESIKEMLFKTLAILDNVLRFFFGTLDKYFKVISSLMVGDFTGAWETIVAIFDSATGGLSKNISIWLQDLGRAFQTGLGGLIGMLGGLWDMLTGSPEQREGAWERVKSGFSNMIKGFKDGMIAYGDLYTSVIDKIKYAAQNFSGQSLHRQGVGIWNSSHLSKMFSEMDKQPRGDDKSNKPGQTNLPRSNSPGANKNPGESWVDKLIKDSESEMKTNIGNRMKDFFKSQNQPAKPVETTSKEPTLTTQLVTKTLREIIFGGKGLTVTSHFGAPRVGYKHKGNDLQAHNDAGALYGSQVYAPEKTQVSGIKRTSHGTIVTLQSLVDKAVTWKLMHMSPSDVAKNIKLGQVFEAGQALNARVGGRAEIQPGDHWSGVHLHLQKERYGEAVPYDVNTKVQVPVDAKGRQLSAPTGQPVVTAPVVSKEVFEAQVTLDELAKHYVKLEQAQKSLGQRTVENASDWDKLNTAMRGIRESKAAKGANLEEALAKERKEQADNFAAAEKTLDELWAKLQARKAKELPLDEQLAAGKKAALDKLKREQAEERNNFKGNEGQTDDLIRMQQQDLSETEAEIDKAIQQEKAKAIEDLAQLDAQHSKDKVKQAQLAIDQQLAADRKALEDKQKLYTEDSDSWKLLENLKIVATEEAEKQRQLIELGAAAEISEARKATILSGLDETEKAFVDGLQGMAKQAQAKGKDLDDFIKQPENMRSLAESLGAGDLEKSLTGVNQLLTETNIQLNAAQKELGLQKEGTQEWEVAQAKVNELSQLQAILAAAAHATNNEGLKQQLLALQAFIPVQEKLSKDHEKFRLVVETISNLVSTVTSSFGEMGGQIGNFISSVASVTMNVSSIVEKFSAIPEGKSLTDFFGDFTNVKDIAGLITTSIATVLSLVSQFIDAEQRVYKARQDLKNSLISYSAAQELARRKSEIDFNKSQGRNVVSAELSYLDDKAEADVKDILLQNMSSYQTALSTMGINSKALEQSDFKVNIQGQLVDLKTTLLSEDLLAAPINDSLGNIVNRELHQKSRQAVIDTQRQIADILTGTTQSKETVLQDQRQRELDAEKTHQNRLNHIKLQQAQFAQNQIGELEAQAQIERDELTKKYEDDYATITFSNDSHEIIKEQLDSLYDSYSIGTQAIDKKLAHDKLQVQADEKKAELAAEAAFQEAKLGQMEDGASKELAILKLNKQRKLDEIDQDMSVYQEDHDNYETAKILRDKEDVGSDTWMYFNSRMESLEGYNKKFLKLAKERSTAVEESENEIQKFMDETKKARKEQLEDLTGEISVLRAQLTDNSVDDVYAEASVSLAQMFRDETEELRQARANHDPEIQSEEQFQKILQGIQEKYRLRRLKAEKEAIQNTAEARKKDQQEAYQKSIDNVQKLIDAEQTKIDKINEQNEALRRQIQVKEELLKQDEKEFDKADTGLFRQAVAGVNYDEQIRQALDDFHNPEGVKTESYSAKSLQEAAFARIELLKLRNENKLALEQYSENDSQENLRQFLLEKERIAALQARVAEEIQRRGGFTYQNEEGQTVYDKLSPKEYADLEKQKSDAYKSFQEARKEALRSATEASVSKINEDITANERLNQAHQDAINGHKTRQQELQNALLASHAAIDLQIEAVMASQNDWAAGVEKLAGNMKGPLSQIVGLYKDIESAVKNAASAVNTPLTPSSSNTNGKPKQPEQGRESYRIAHFQLDGGDGWFYTSDQNKQEWQAMDRWQAGQKSASSSSSSGSGGGNTAKPFQTGFVDGVYNDYDANGNQRSTNPAYMTPEQKIAAYGSSYYTQGKFATGGVVPAGFPNDTYPALLTSGEAVLPTWFTNLLASAYKTMPGLSGLIDNSRKIQITLQGVFNEPGMVKREIMQALQQANYSAAGVNGTYYMNTGLN